MPKMKTNRGTAKRFKRTGTGALKRRRANRNHLLTKRANKVKRQARSLTGVHAADVNGISRLLKDK